MLLQVTGKVTIIESLGRAYLDYFFATLCTLQRFVKSVSLSPHSNIYQGVGSIFKCECKKEKLNREGDSVTDIEYETTFNSFLNWLGFKLMVSL